MINVLFSTSQPIKGESSLTKQKFELHRKLEEEQRLYKQRLEAYKALHAKKAVEDSKQVHVRVKVTLKLHLIYEPCHEKTCLLGFPLDLTQTRLYCHRRWLKAWDLASRVILLSMYQKQRQ